MGRLVCGIVLLLSAVCFAHQHTEHKNGSCPPVIALRQSNSTFTDSNSTNMRVPDECYTDSSCSFIHKCCNSSDGVFRCTHPIFQPTTTVATNVTTRALNVSADVVKEGRCPFPLFGSTIACNDFTCTTDSDCYSSQKCCPSSTGQDHCSSCQSPIFDYNRTTMKPYPEVVKEGRCPFPLFGSTIACNDFTCTTDSDCYSSQKCCPSSTGQDHCSSCQSPIFDYNRTTMKPYRVQPGICPENFNRYYEYYGYNENGDYANCPNHCNETRDCDEGELCCVPEVEPPIYYDTPEWKRHADHQSNTPGCPVCKKAELRCRGEYGTYYQDKELYQPGSDECTLCQCFEGFPHCYQVCDQDNYYGGRGHWHAGWLPAGILSGVSLLISVIFSLSLCCCMKLCCSGKKNTIVVPQPPAMQVQAQVPPQYYLHRCER